MEYINEKTSHLAVGDSTPENALWKIQEIPRKGKGIIVTRDITPGTLLISEAPILDTSCITSFSMDATETDLANALKKLPQEKQDSFRSLHNNYAATDASHPLSGIVKSNAYPFGPGAEIGGVFEVISRINHACNPNSVQYWNPILEHQTIYAVRPIPAGTEITTSYHEGGPSSSRQKILKEDFGFTCSCALCSLPSAELEASDVRLSRAQALDSLIGDGRKVHHEPDAVFKSCRELFDIYEKENVKDGRLSRLYYDCFQMCNLHSDLARARCFAKYYVDTKKTAEGKDSMNVMEMEPYVKNPQKHESYGSTEKWKTSAKDVPKGLKAKEFARWLWRESV